MKYIEVILPLRLPNRFTYRISEEVPLYARVLVPFGVRRQYTGIVMWVGDVPPVSAKDYTLKDVIAVLREPAVIVEPQVKLWEWVSSYYMCTMGEVYHETVPASLRMERVLPEPRRKSGQLGITEVEVSAIALPELSAASRGLLESIVSTFGEHTVCLFQYTMITRSSELQDLYLHLLIEELKMGRQVLYLVPGLLVARRLERHLLDVLGSHVIFYHTGLSESNRVRAWRRIASGESVLVMGIRSSVFLPFTRLGLVIIDDEHDPSYKQPEPSPRYHARNAAIVLASLHSAKTLLSSPTPSLESYQNVRTKKYGYVCQRLEECVNQLPCVEVIDIKELRRRKIMKGLFSPRLIELINLALSRNEQVILFQPRRGFAQVISCKSCGAVLRCAVCGVTLNYHSEGIMLCHSCGNREPYPPHCPHCSGELRLVGFGTEQVEQEVRALFPTRLISRLDGDTASTPAKIAALMSDFASGATEILIGTQMISRSVEGCRVSVACILNVDSLMNLPDFRTHERAYQTVRRLIGLVGYADVSGSVLIQTSQPDHPLVLAMSRGDYASMSRAQLTERYQFRYPPYTRLITLVLSSTDESGLLSYADSYVASLQELLGTQVYGPVVMPLRRKLHTVQIILKLEPDAGVVSVRDQLREVEERLYTSSVSKRIKLYYDVDN